MDIIYRGRGCGKTTELIKRSYESGAYILVTDHKRARAIADHAKQLGVDIPYPITWPEWENTYYKNHGTGTTGCVRNLLIDDADDLLALIFRGATIDAMTMTSDEIIVIDGKKRGMRAEVVSEVLNKIRKRRAHF